MVVDKPPVPGVLLFWISVGQGSAALAVGAGGVVLTFFLSSIISLSLSLGDGPIQTEILSQRPKQPTKHSLDQM